MKSCRDMCDRCAWRDNGGCSEWMKKKIPKYIDREDTIEILTRMQWHDENGYPVEDYEDKRQYAIDWISQVPIVDAKLVVHGKWNGYGECSACGKPWDELMTNNGDDCGYWYEMPPYCPNCGAKMDRST